MGGGLAGSGAAVDVNDDRAALPTTSFHPFTPHSPPSKWPSSSPTPLSSLLQPLAAPHHLLPLLIYLSHYLPTSLVLLSFICTCSTAPFFYATSRRCSPSFIVAHKAISPCRLQSVSLFHSRHLIMYMAWRCTGTPLHTFSDPPARGTGLCSACSPRAAPAGEAGTGIKAFLF